MGRGKKRYRGKSKRYGDKSYNVNLSQKRRLVFVSVVKGKEGHAQRDLVCAYEETLSTLYPDLKPLIAPKKLQKYVIMPEDENTYSDISNASKSLSKGKTEIIEEHPTDVSDDGTGSSRLVKRAKISSKIEASPGFFGDNNALEKEMKALESPHVQYIRGPMGMVILDFPSEDVDPVKMTIETLRRFLDFGDKPTRWAFKFFPVVSTCYVKMDKMKKLAIDVLSKHISGISDSACQCTPITSDEESSNKQKIKPDSFAVGKLASTSKEILLVAPPVAVQVKPTTNDQEVCNHSQVESGNTLQGKLLVTSEGNQFSSSDNKTCRTSGDKSVSGSADQQVSSVNKKLDETSGEKSSVILTEESEGTNVYKSQSISESKQSVVTEDVIGSDIEVKEPEVEVEGEPKEEVTYFIEYKKRSNSSVHRPEILGMLMEVIPSNWKNRWKGDTDWVIIFQILGKICGMSVVKGSEWRELGGFNLNKLQEIRDRRL